MSDRSCFVFGAGPFFGLSKVPAPNDYIIAADGGYEHCLSTGLRPHLLLGDFDSIPSLPSQETIQQFPVEKDDTDTMLALKTGLSMGFRTFHIYGGTGGRMDHTIANLQALSFLAHENAQGFLYDEGFVFTALRNGSLRLPPRNQGIFSIFCLGPDAHGVSIQGAQYPLQHGTLSSTFPLGVSNHFLGEPVEIRVEDGCLLIGWELPKSTDSVKKSPSEL